MAQGWRPARVDRRQGSVPWEAHDLPRGFLLDAPVALLENWEGKGENWGGRLTEASVMSSLHESQQPGNS